MFFFRVSLVTQLDALTVTQLSVTMITQPGFCRCYGYPVRRQLWTSMERWEGV